VPSIRVRSRVDVPFEALQLHNVVPDGWADTGLSGRLFVEVRDHLIGESCTSSSSCQSRIVLFLGCRKYLLRTLYHDLLSSAKSDAMDIGDGGDELLELPQPTTGNTKPGHEPRGYFHSTLARTTFSVCFGESTILFALLMFQGLDILDAR